MENFNHIREHFAIIEDTRHSGYVKHHLVDILILIMGAVVCGITELCDMMVYFEEKSDFYREKFGIENYPSKSTLSRILNMVDGDKIGKIIVKIMEENAGNIGEIVAIDGKAIRSTGDKEKSHSFLQVVTAYATESGICLGQSCISHEDKTNEIPVFQTMLDTLDIKGKTITADAMHCQKETCKKIIKKGGNYVLGLKGNQVSLLEDVRLFLENSVNFAEITTFQTIEKNGGRIEKRICKATSSIQWMGNLTAWAGLQSVFSVERTVTVKDVTTQETSFYISSLPVDAKNLLKISRSHWKIESMHWMLDVIWHEDSSGILSENGHKTLNSFRKLALLAHKRYIDSLPRKVAVKRNVLTALLDNNTCFQVLLNL